MDAYVFLISASYVSATRFRKLADALVEEAPCHAVALRLEGEGQSLWRVLDTLAAEGASRIQLRPIGLPFSQSLERWLPGAAASWLHKRGEAAPELFLARPAEEDARIVRNAARARVPASRIAPLPDGELGKGWDAPPEFRHHLLVCAGPRCHLKDAPHLVDVLKAELRRAGVSADCLVTTTGCLFPCNAGPVIVHYPKGHWYRVTDVADVRTVVTQAIGAGATPRHLLIHRTGDTHEPV
jgi:(2Fe-2S) ferredoxin